MYQSILARAIGDVLSLANLLDVLVK